MPTISFLPANNILIGTAPEPEPTTLNIPSWWKEQPTTINGEQHIVDGSYKFTVKKCQAIFDALATGYVLKAPVDIFIDSKKERHEAQVPYDWKHASPLIISSHPREQVSMMPIDKSIFMPDILRIHPLWVVKTPPGYSTLFLPPMHGKDLPIEMVPGVIDTDTFVTDGHLSFFVKRNFNGVIKQGTPIAQILPFKREDWDHIIHDYDANTIERQRKKIRSTFSNGYRMKFWSKKEYR
jgi:hypothetical protein